MRPHTIQTRCRWSVKITALPTGAAGFRSSIRGGSQFRSPFFLRARKRASSSDDS